MDSLVLMACSGTKLNVPAPAFDFYQGVMYETFRVHVRPHARPNVIILSALHGFISPEKVLSPYENKMTGERAEEMIADLPRFMTDVLWPRNVKHVFLAGGFQYRRVMRAAVTRIDPSISIDECSGGIGFQRSQLGRYLDGLGRQPGKTISHHPNGTPLFDSFGEFKVEETIVTKYRSAPWATQRTAVIHELFEGPNGPTARIELSDGKMGRKEVRWIGLDDIQKFKVS